MLKGMKATVAGLGIVLLALLALGPVGLGAAQPAPPPLNPETIGLVDPAQIQQQFPAYVSLMALKKAYDAELVSQNSYLRSVYQSYLAELNKQREQELEGKTDEEKKIIEVKYAQMAKNKETEIGLLLQAKIKELQEKLNAENTKADQKVKEAIESVCAKDGLPMVLNKGAVYFGGLDVTEKVITAGIAKK